MSLEQSMNLQDSLSLFGLPNLEGQTEETLKKHYHILAQKYHPDKGGSTQEFIALRKAYVYLRTSLHDPNRSSTTHGAASESTSKEQAKYEREKRYYQSTSSQSSQSQQEYYYNTNNSSQEHNGYQSGKTGSNENQTYESETTRRYREAYNRAVDQIRQYEDILNAQINIINSTNRTVNKRYSQYNLTRDKLKETLDLQIAALDKRHYRSWWQHVVPVPKINRQDYILQYNMLIKEYNETVRSIDDSFMSDLIKQYQTGFERIIEHLK